MMKRAEVEEWIQALKSDEFTQGKHYLNMNNKQCCLGVKCILDVRANRHSIVQTTNKGNFGIAYYGLAGWFVSAESMPSDEILGKWGLSRVQAGELASLNDRGIPFSEIAEWIRHNVPVED